MKYIIDEYLDLPNRSLFQKIVCIVTNRFRCYDSVSRILVKLFLKPYIK